MNSVHTESGLSFKSGTPIWVHRDGWAGRTRRPAVLVKVNEKRSRIRYVNVSGDPVGDTTLAPNGSITKRYVND